MLTRLRITLAALFLFPLSAQAMGPAAPAVRVPILMYHYIQDPGPVKNNLFIPPDVFDRQLQWLSDNGYCTVDLDRMMQIFHGTDVPACKPVVLTFDDGWESSYTNVLPLLQKHAMKGVFYVISGFVGRPNFLSAKQVKALADHGMMVQDHTVSHVDLRKVAERDARKQLGDSKLEIVAMTGHPVTHVAYPSGKYNSQVLATAASLGYVTGVTTHPGIASSQDDPLQLPRVRMQTGTRLSLALR